MATINEDLFESQHNSSCKKTRNEDLREVTQMTSPVKQTKQSFTEFSSISGIDRELSASVTSLRNTYRRKIGTNCKQSVATDYQKLINGYQGSLSSRNLAPQTNKHSTKGILYSLLTSLAFKK